VHCGNGFDAGFSPYQSTRLSRYNAALTLGADMRRREFISLLGTAAAWPLAARAQQPDRMRRIGVLMSTAADDPEGQARTAAFHQGLQQLGWTIGQNVWIDSRWPAGDPEHFRRYAAELVALSPNVILATGSAAAGPLLQATRTGRGVRGVPLLTAKDVQMLRDLVCDRPS
jgi:hypothetical protein